MCERYWFLHPIGGAALPVHVVFSPALHVAEVKAADMKALRLDGVAVALGGAADVDRAARAFTRAAKRPSLGLFGESAPRI